MLDLSAIYVPYSGGSPERGSETGAEYIKGLRMNFVHTYDVPVNGERRDIEHYIARHVAYCSGQAQDLNTVPVVFGGDHTTVYGNVLTSADRYGDTFGLVWIDAHADFNTPETSLTGNTHGMILSKICGLQQYPQIVSPDRVALLGARSIDDEELELLKQHNINIYSSHYMNIFDSHIDVMKNFIMNGIENVHISIDVDVLDANGGYVGVATPSDKDGISEETLERFIRLFHANMNIVSLDIVEYVPYKDTNYAVFRASQRILGGI